MSPQSISRLHTCPADLVAHLGSTGRGTLDELKVLSLGYLMAVFE